MKPRRRSRSKRRTRIRSRKIQRGAGLITKLPVELDFKIFEYLPVSDLLNYLRDEETRNNKEYLRAIFKTLLQKIGYQSSDIQDVIDFIKMEPSVLDTDDDVFEGLVAVLQRYLETFKKPSEINKIYQVISYSDILKMIMLTPHPKYKYGVDRYVELLTLILKIALYIYFESNSNLDNWKGKWDSANEEQKMELLFYEVALDTVILQENWYWPMSAQRLFTNIQREKMYHIYETYAEHGFPVLARINVGTNIWYPIRQAGAYENISAKINNILRLLVNLPPRKRYTVFLNLVTREFNHGTRSFEFPKLLKREREDD